MPFIADLHIHSKYSRATSKDMDLAALAKWAKIKGVSMMGTGDFTHPLWFSELKNKLKESDLPGVFQYEGIYFILTAEVSNIYFKAGRTRKVHNLIFSPSFETVEEITSAVSEYGILSSDGRPILSLECDKMVRMLTEIDERVFFIPGHAWTPHFSIFGSNSGFDSPEECFEDQTGKIFSIETGLSSDPQMNWRWSKLDRFCLTSNSDAHSPSKLGREANVFKDKISYADLAEILRTKDKARFLYTIEFFPEEGKYHWDGHRGCKACLSPQESRNINNICPVCGKKVTIGVMHRLESLADRSADYIDSRSPFYKRVVPLEEIIADAFGVKSGSVRVEREYHRLVKNFGTEFRILLDMSEAELKASLPERIASGIINVRSGNVEISPGYDGEYGEVRVFKKGDEAQEKQLKFF